MKRRLAETRYHICHNCNFQFEYGTEEKVPLPTDTTPFLHDRGH